MVFTTPDNSIPGSAVCRFSLQDINDAFTGDFKDQVNYIFLSIYLTIRISIYLSIPGSAVCRFSLQDINDAFTGDFKDEVNYIYLSIYLTICLSLYLYLDPKAVGSASRISMMPSLEILKIR